MRVLLSLLFLGTSLFADVKVVTFTEGTKVGDKVEYATGNILLYPEADNNFKHRIALQSVKAVVQNETSSAKFLREAFLKGKYKAIVSGTGAGLLKKNFHTGWGQKCAFYLAMSYMKENKLEEASQVIKTGKSQVAGENLIEDKLLLELAGKYLEFAKNNKLLNMISFKKVKVPEFALGKMFYYQLEGMLLEREEQDSLAVLAYYKGIFLGVKSLERKEVVARVERIYKNQGDPRKLPDLNKL